MLYFFVKITYLYRCPSLCMSLRFVKSSYCSTALHNCTRFIFLESCIRTVSLFSPTNLLIVWFFIEKSSVGSIQCIFSGNDLIFRNSPGKTVHFSILKEKRCRKLNDVRQWGHQFLHGVPFLKFFTGPLTNYKLISLKRAEARDLLYFYPPCSICWATNSMMVFDDTFIFAPEILTFRNSPDKTVHFAISKEKRCKISGDVRKWGRQLLHGVPFLNFFTGPSTNHKLISLKRVEARDLSYFYSPCSIGWATNSMMVFWWYFHFCSRNPNISQ